MHRTFHPAALALALLLALGLTFLGGCGGGGGGGGEDPPEPTPDPTPTLTSINPNQGSTAGGTPVALIGSDFTAPATVLIGGNPATGITIVDAGRITCTTPAGTTGIAKIVEVTTNGDTVRLLEAYNYYPPPTVSSTTPTVGSTFGGMAVVLTGTGFQANTPGAPTVTIGGTPATAVFVVDDTSLSCVVPAHAPGNAAVSVTNLNGTGDLSPGLLYFTPILAAESAAVSGVPHLYAIDPASGSPHVVGPLDYGVTGMAFASDGTLYGTTAPGPSGGARELITIDPSTGSSTLVGTTDDGMLTNYPVPDIAFVNDLLYGTDGPAGNTLQIDTTTANVSVIGPNPAAGKGSAFVSNASGTTWYMSSNMGPLYTVVPSTSIYTAGPTLGGSVSGGLMLGGTFHNGSLYAIEFDGVGVWRLVTVNTTNGTFSNVTVVAPGVSAVASPTP